MEIYPHFFRRNLNKVLKGHTVKLYHYNILEALKQHVMSFLFLYNYQKKLKALKFQTPYDTIIQIYQENPEYFNLNPESKTFGTKHVKELL